MSVFFFFKQKTAYEMRISDWSSDVCSSDLPVALLHRHDRHLAGRRFGDVCRGRVGRHAGVAAGGTGGPAAGGGVGLGGGVEIGRASCRESVCPVRVDLGGRRIIKKKKTQEVSRTCTCTHKETLEHA